MLTRQPPTDIKYAPILLGISVRFLWARPHVAGQSAEAHYLSEHGETRVRTTLLREVASDDALQNHVLDVLLNIGRDFHLTEVQQEFAMLKRVPTEIGLGKESVQGKAINLGGYRFSAIEKSGLLVTISTPGSADSPQLLWLESSLT